MLPFHPQRTMSTRTFQAPPPIKIKGSRFDAPSKFLEQAGTSSSIPAPWYLRPRKGVTTVIPRAKKGGKGDDLASKYCFSAKIQLYEAIGKPPIGVIFAFDRNSDVIKQVETVASVFIDDTGYVVGQTEVIMHRECPVEITDEVFVQLFDSPRGTGSQDHA